MSPRPPATVTPCLPASTAPSRAGRLVSSTVSPTQNPPAPRIAVGSPAAGSPTPTHPSRVATPSPSHPALAASPPAFGATVSAATAGCSVPDPRPRSRSAGLPTPRRTAPAANRPPPRATAGPATSGCSAPAPRPPPSNRPSRPAPAAASPPSGRGFAGPATSARSALAARLHRLRSPRARAPAARSAPPTPRACATRATSGPGPKAS